MTRHMARSPAVLEAYLALRRRARRRRARRPKLREQIALVTAEINGCEYCLSAHAAIGQGRGPERRRTSPTARGARSDGPAGRARAAVRPRAGRRARPRRRRGRRRAARGRARRRRDRRGDRQRRAQRLHELLQQRHARWSTFRLRVASA